MSAVLNEMFNGSSAGLCRIEGVALMVVEWFRASGGLHGLEEVLDRIGVDNIAALEKKDHAIGLQVLQVMDYYGSLRARLASDRSMSLAVGIVRAFRPDSHGESQSSYKAPHGSPKGDVVEGAFWHDVRFRLACTVGQEAMPWWEKNLPRIKRVRKDLKIVRSVQNS